MNLVRNLYFFIYLEVLLLMVSHKGEARQLVCETNLENVETHLWNNLYNVSIDRIFIVLIYEYIKYIKIFFFLYGRLY